MVFSLWILPYPKMSVSSLVVIGRDVSRIFDGDSPADMAIEGPTRYEMGVSRKAAAAIGLALPASIVQKADRVIA